MIIAATVFDHYTDEPHDREFHYDAMTAWWGWFVTVTADEITEAPKVKFRLYDDDDELYFSGWLYNDAECMVQQFVLDWAKADSGCTTIKVHDKEKGWVQEIG